MARAGLGPRWQCLFANDFDQKKGSVYRLNWKDDVLCVDDVRNIKIDDLPSRADLAWASFPCQDLSLAGGGAGLEGERSGRFWPYWSLIESLVDDGRAPRMLVLENVCGTLTSHEGRDFMAICRALSAAGYRYGAVVMDAALFLPQSRPRLFIIGIRNDIEIPNELIGSDLSKEWHTRSLHKAFARLSVRDREAWVCWRMPLPGAHNTSFANLVEKEPSGVVWHSREETASLLDKMSELNLAKVETAKKSGRPMIGSLYKRTRFDADGEKIQRAEVRFDDIAGCLRTPAGGSSRQLILVVNGASVRSRLISARETARLMGLQDDYVLPENYNDAYHLTGDGVVVPVVRHLANHLLEPILSKTNRVLKDAA
jgi:DNA (cytosine-5)-methyltransferase 1